MAAVLVLAVTTDGEIALVRQHGEQVEEMSRRWFLHFRAVFPDERPPFAFVLGMQCESHQRLAWRQFGEPHVVVITLCEFSFWYATRRPAHGAEARTFALGPWSSQADDSDWHRDQ